MTALRAVRPRIGVRGRVGQPRVRLYFGQCHRDSPLWTVHFEHRAEQLATGGEHRSGQDVPVEGAAQGPHSPTGAFSPAHAR